MKTKINTKILFDKMNKPKGLYSILSIPNTNVHIVKTSKNMFGVAFSNTLYNGDFKYKNLILEKHHNLKTSENINLNKVLIISIDKNIDTLIFSEIIDTFLFDRNKNKYTEGDIKALLKKLDNITEKNRNELNKIIGVWGELYFLNLMIDRNDKKSIYNNLVSSWQGLSGRSIIDFVLKHQRLKFEIKTTSKDLRIHTFHSLDQVKDEINFNSYLVSICVNLDDSGQTCNDIVEKIKKKLDNESIKLLDEKIKVRGLEALNKKYKIILNKEKILNFYKFSNVPKPVIDENILKIEWDAYLENSTELSKNEENKLLRL